MIKTVVRAALLSAVAIAPLATAQPATAPRPDVAKVVDTTATKASLLEADARLSALLEREGPEALIRQLDANAAVLMPEQVILRGPAEARAPLTKRYGRPSRYRWVVKHAVASLDGRFGCTVGIIRYTNAADSIPKEKGGVYETCWRRNAVGDWMIVGLQSQDDPRPAPAYLYLVDAPFTRTPHSATFARGQDPLREALDADTRFASLAAGIDGAGPAFVAFAASDAISLISPDSARGRDEIAGLFQGVAGELALLWNPDRSFGAASGGLAFTVGRSVRYPLLGQKMRERHGKFLTVWRQNEDGSWSWIFDLGSLRRWEPG